MKKLISIFLILCMMATLLPTVAFATEGEEATGNPIVANFTTVQLTSDSKLQGATASEFTIVGEESTTQKAYKITNNSVSYLKVSTYKSDAGTFYVWPDKTVQGLMFTINVNCEHPGYYIPDVVHGKSNVGGKYAVYINGQYAGDIQTRDNSLGETADTVEKTITKNETTLNAVKLQEGENEISFRLSEQYLRNWETTEFTKAASFLYLNNLTLTPCEEAFVPVTFDTTDFPSKVVAGKPAEFTVSANINEALTKFTGTYNEDGSTMQTNLTVASENGTFDIAEQGTSVVNGTFTATNGGAATITATANVNGKQYTETIKSTAVAPIVAEFTKTDTTNIETTNYGDYDINNLAGNGYSVDTENSKTGTIIRNDGDHIMASIYYSSSGRTNYYWPDTNNNYLKFTIKVTAPQAGYYSTDFAFKATNMGAGFTMYVNGVAAGEIDGYIRGYNATEDRKATLNTVHLDAGENTVSFRLTKNYLRTLSDGTDDARINQGFWFYPRKLTFTPVDAAPTPVGFETTLTETKVGEPVEFTVKPVMSDGVNMYFGAYNDEGTKITDTPITLTANNGEVTNLTRTTEGVSGIYTATAAGTATITASTNINGTPYENTFNVTVTADEDEVVTLPTTIKMSVSTAEEDKGYLVVNGTAQTASVYVYEDIAVGSDVTVVANPIEGKIFRGWLRGGSDGVVVSLDPKYEFKAATNVALFAKYTEAPAENAEAKEFYDWNGEFLAYDSYDSNLLSKYGFKFKEWLEARAEKIIRYVADYEANTTHDITYEEGITSSPANTMGIDHETEVTLTSTTPVSWYVNGTLAAYGSTYTFYATEDADITVDSEVQTSPIVKLDKVDSDTYILEYNANDNTVIEKGIVIGSGEPSVTSCFYKVISQRNEAFGKLMTKNNTSYSAVRGYIIYKDSNNTHRVVYTDIK